MPEYYKKWTKFYGVAGVVLIFHKIGSFVYALNVEKWYKTAY
jgi:hypothetical protein